MIIIIGIVVAIFLIFIAGLTVIGVSSIIPEYVWFYIVWGYITIGVGTHIVCFILDIIDDKDLAKKMECCRCEGRCDKCVANKFRIRKNLIGPQQRKLLVERKYL